MPELKINHEKVTSDIAKELVSICPFGALNYEDNKLSVNSACKMCKLCVKKGPAGVMEFVEDKTTPTVNKDEWKGVAVFADCEQGVLHPVTLELLGKAKELAAVINHPVYAIVIGENTTQNAKTLLSYGADKVFVYDSEIFKEFSITTYANAFSDFVEKIKPSSVLVGATNMGRSLAPRVAARFRTGLTADCTVLEMRENTDLVQIRPAFGGNIMAQILSPKTRPQFCTVRYKIFSAPEKVSEPTGSIENMKVDLNWEDNRVKVTDAKLKPKVTDLSEADIIVAVGRGIKTPADLELAKELADLLGASLACTRPLVENGWMNASQQIGLSGKTVKPKLIITLGISGSVQFAAGMKSSDLIIAVNNDKNASIFDIAHYCVVGDIYEVVPQIIEKVKEARADV